MKPQQNMGLFNRILGAVVHAMVMHIKGQSPDAAMFSFHLVTSNYYYPPGANERHINGINVTYSIPASDYDPDYDEPQFAHIQYETTFDSIQLQNLFDNKVIGIALTELAQPILEYLRTLAKAMEDNEYDVTEVKKLAIEELELNPDTPVNQTTERHINTLQTLSTRFLSYRHNLQLLRAAKVVPPLTYRPIHIRNFLAKVKDQAK